MKNLFKQTYRPLLFGLFLLAALFFLSQETIAQQAFKHTTSSGNISGHMTTIDNPMTNKKPKALVFLSQLYGKYNAHQAGIWYSNEKWVIYNEDKAKMPQGTGFSVMVLPPSDVAFSHMASARNIDRNWTVIDHPKCNNNPKAILLVTQNWKGKYNPKAIGVWYTKGKWAIYNQDKSPMPAGVNFNVLVANEGFVSEVIGRNRGSILTANAATKKNGAGKHVAISSDSDKNNLLFVTQNWQSAGVYNNHIVSTWKSGGKWTVYNQDRAEIPNNAKFNLLVVSTEKPKYVRIQNRWQKDGKTDYKINIEGKTVAAGATKPNWWSAQWAFEPVGEGNFYRIRNRWQKNGKTNYYLNNEGGKIAATGIKSGWWSAQWSVEKVADGNFYRIRNRWKPNEYLHIQGPTLESSPMKPNWWSAMWDLGKFR